MGHGFQFANCKITRGYNPIRFQSIPNIYKSHEIKIPSDSSPTSSNVIYPHLNHLCQCFPSWPLCFGAQRFVDVGALLQRLPRGPGALLPLRPRQVHQVQLGKDVPATGACYCIYTYIYIYQS